MTADHFQKGTILVLDGVFASQSCFIAAWKEVESVNCLQEFSSLVQNFK